jgi:hypothetical protein
MSTDTRAVQTPQTTTIFTGMNNTRGTRNSDKSGLFGLWSNHRQLEARPFHSSWEHAHRSCIRHLVRHVGREGLRGVELVGFRGQKWL